MEAWCQCGRCQQMPTAAQRICCADHDTSNKMTDEMRCITEHPGVLDLMKPAVLEVAYTNYLCYHGKNKSITLQLIATHLVIILYSISVRMQDSLSGLDVVCLQITFYNILRNTLSRLGTIRDFIML